ncbi:hypothetical protein LTS18_007362 [Coniosporium uncinatum]|uniref:Uncharacterized protein n=2 Tax=Coniosporium uncinatum TaxID=93489 RepID=A0ACC3D2Z6_9PEZI|nr:hypothetical protein LTS18_001302 [Coniosporium uncinatum]KAK3060942.1 hypothetical protein LTS18_007362 [Coniosporium uncinatum]
MFFVAGGTFPCTPAIVAWLSNNLAGQWKRATGMALEFTIGNMMGGVIGSNIYLANEKPNYSTAYNCEAAFVGLGIVVAIVQVVSLRMKNAGKEKRVRSAEEEGRDLDAECKDLGDKNPHFRYTL